MITVNGTNGFGSFKKTMRFSVPKDKAGGLLDDGWECIGEKGGRSFFRFDFVDTDREDHETALHILNASLCPKLLTEIRLKERSRPTV